MAAAEARAVWQRTANRCFVQEDARRAPKLACCQSSSASKQADAAAPADRQDQPAAGFALLSRNPPYSNTSSDTSWWLHLQPDYGYRRGFTFEQISSLEKDDAVPKAGILNSTSHKRKETASDLERNGGILDGESHSAKKIAGNVRVYTDLEDSMDGWEKMQTDTKKPNEMCFDTEYSWVGSEKSEPWWRMADRDELVSLVSRKSHDHVENCDLPPPQKMCLRSGTRACVGCFNSEKISESSLDWKTQTGHLSSATVLSQGFANPGRVQEKVGSDESSSYKNTMEIFSKAELMEALHHSQTRARKAEKAAKSAYAEKDHIVALFFRQASLLFAYKQWLQLLQLETLCAQFKNNDDNRICTLFPLALLPWMSSNRNDGRPTKRLSKAVESSGGERREHVNHDVTKYAVAFALGLSLVGAGLLLGWTVGWMFPHM